MASFTNSFPFIIAVETDYLLFHSRIVNYHFRYNFILPIHKRGSARFAAHWLSTLERCWPSEQREQESHEFDNFRPIQWMGRAHFGLDIEILYRIWVHDSLQYFYFISSSIPFEVSSRSRAQHAPFSSNYTRDDREYTYKSFLQALLKLFFYQYHVSPVFGSASKSTGAASSKWLCLVHQPKTPLCKKFISVA